MVNRGYAWYMGYEWITMAGTWAMTVDCWYSDSHDWMMWPVHKAMRGYEASTCSTVV